MHYTDNKSNVNASANKTPFLIEDILDRSTIKTTNNLITLKKHNLENLNGECHNYSSRTNGSESTLIADKSGKQIGEMSATDSEFRRLTQSDRLVFFLYIYCRKSSLVFL